MNVQSIKIKNGIEVMNLSRDVSPVELSIIKHQIHNRVSVMKRLVKSTNQPYEEIVEGDFKGFISDLVQILMCENYVEYTIAGTTTQVSFTYSEHVEQSLMAA